MTASEMAPTMDADKIGEVSLAESVDMDKDNNPILGELHKFVLEKNVAGLRSFLFHRNGEEVWSFPDFANFFDQRDGMGRTPLQLALVKGLPTMVAALFNAASKVKSADWKSRISEKMCKIRFKNLQRDTTPIIVLALSTAVERNEESTDRAIECVKVLVERAKSLENDEAAKDMLQAKASFNRGVLHYAGQLGKHELIEYLITVHKRLHLLEDAIMEECSARKLPIHYAIDSNNKDSIRILLTETLVTKSKDVKEELLLRIGRYCVRRSLFLFFDVLEDDKANMCNLLQRVQRQAEVDFSKRILSPRKRSNPGMDEPKSFSSEDYTCKLVHSNRQCKEEKSTAILTDNACFAHLEMPVVNGAKRYTIIQSYQENPHRLEVVLCALRSLGDQVEWVPPSRKFRWVMPWISKIHTPRYVEMVKQSVKNSLDKITLSLEDNYTCVSTRSMEAAKGAVRSVLNAVDTVMEEHIRNAFAAVRPPGHHVGPDGMTNTHMDYDREEYLGNCIFNNVAIAAVYAMEKYPDKIKRVAIMDFDIHHGNGTEKVVEEYSGGKGKWFYTSIHGHDGQGLEFYPGSGFNKSTDSVVNVQLNIRNVNKPASSRELRGKFRRHVTKGLNQFKPDLIIISAGFDGHENCFVRETNFKDEDYT